MEQAITRCMTVILYMIFSLFEKTGKKLDLPSLLICISRKSMGTCLMFFIQHGKNESDVLFVVRITAKYTFQACERSRN